MNRYNLSDYASRKKIEYIFRKLPKVIYHNKYSILKKKISDISNLHMKLNKAFIDINNTWLSPTKIRRITIIGSKKMIYQNLIF